MLLCSGLTALEKTPEQAGPDLAAFTGTAQPILPSAMATGEIQQAEMLNPSQNQKPTEQAASRVLQVCNTWQHAVFY